MDNKLNEKVLDKLTKICTCTGTSRASIKKAIEDRASTFEQVKEKTGAGTGGCCGRKCKGKIEDLIDSKQ